MQGGILVNGEKVVNIFRMIVFLEYSKEVGWFHLRLNSGSICNSLTVPYLLELLAVEERGRAVFVIFPKKEVTIRQNRAVVFRVKLYHLFVRYKKIVYFR